MSLSESTSNIMENIAYRLAEGNNGIVRPSMLLAYLPVSLDLIRDSLDQSVDDCAVFRKEEADDLYYYFPACENKTSENKTPVFDGCAGCNADTESFLCKTCRKAMNKDLMKAAEQNGWPSKAVYEHEIFYLAGKLNDPLHAEKLAGNSRYTLGSMNEKLKKMVKEKSIRMNLESKDGLMTYEFPKLTYPKNRYRENMRVIRNHPTAIQEDTEIKLIRILCVLALMLLAVLVLIFCKVPLPLLIPAYILTAPIVAFSIWHKKLEPIDL